MKSLHFMDSIQTKLGERIQEIRKERSFSQEDLAFKCGLHRTYISDVERGARNISIRNLKRIAQSLEISLSDLLKDL